MDDVRKKTISIDGCAEGLIVVLTTVYWDRVEKKTRLVAWDKVDGFLEEMNETLRTWNRKG